MNTKHTQGPWRTNPNGLGGLEALVYPEGSEHPVASVTGYFNSSGQTLHNLRLIAAAPQLLEALIDCRRALEIANFSQELAIVEAAIAKATGEPT